MLVLSDIVIVVKSPESIIIGNRILIYYISIIINISTWVSLSYELFFIIIIHIY